MIHNVIDKVQGKAMDKAVSKKFDDLFGGSSSNKKSKEDKNNRNN